jgi:hypothetical protein
MNTSGYDCFFTPAGEKERVRCKVCGSDCEILRNVFGPTCFAEALAQMGHIHDEFRCPRAGENWHQIALDLVKKIEHCPSKRITQILERDLGDLLRNNGIIANVKIGDLR